MRFELAVWIHTVETEAAAPCCRHRAGLVASDEGPDTLTVDVHVHGGRRSHLPPAWKPGPLPSRNARAASVRQSLDGAIRIVRRSLCEGRHAGGGESHDSAQHHQSDSNCLRHDTPLFGDNGVYENAYDAQIGQCESDASSGKDAPAIHAKAPTPADLADMALARDQMRR